jgi:hypothetical protein
MTKKNPAAVALGRKGGEKGGKKKHPRKGFGSLTPEQRKEAARKAAAARWGKAKPKTP